LIFSRKITYQEGFNYIKEKRPVINPNMGFIAQLIWFYKRLHEESFDSVPTNPRVFVIGSHELEDPMMIVARMLLENVYQDTNSKSLDPRGVFVIQGQKEVRIWIGEECPSGNREAYLDYAKHFLGLI